MGSHKLNVLHFHLKFLLKKYFFVITELPIDVLVKSIEEDHGVPSNNILSIILVSSLRKKEFLGLLLRAVKGFRH